jgi:hypothetical protein
VFTGTTYHADEGGGGVPHFSYAKADRRVTAYYFYLVDEAFGAAFVKICAYFPYPIKIWLNGHEYGAPCGASSYPRCSWEEFGGTFLGSMTYLDLKSEGNSSMVRHEAPCRIPGAAGKDSEEDSWA